MRRHVAVSVRTLAAVALLLAGAIYVAAEARQVAVRREAELTSLEAQAFSRQQAAISQTKEQAASASSAAAAESDELAAEQQAAQLPPQKPANKHDGHTRQIVISIPDRRLALIEDGELVKTYPIAVGTRSTPSPEGDFEVINHAKNPTYRHKGKEIAPGKDNPLGTRWMGLSLKGYGIHGTNVPSSIGKAASHGCFRMAKADVEDLYSRVQVGDKVTIRRQRDELIAQTFAMPRPASRTGAGDVAVKTAASHEIQVASSAVVPAVTAEQQQ